MADKESIQAAVAAVAVVFVFYSFTRWIFLALNRLARFALYTPAARFPGKKTDAAARAFQTRGALTCEKVVDDCMLLTPRLSVPLGYAAIIAPCEGKCVLRIVYGPFELTKIAMSEAGESSDLLFCKRVYLTRFFLQERKRLRSRATRSPSLWWWSCRVSGKNTLVFSRECFFRTCGERYDRKSENTMSVGNDRRNVFIRDGAPGVVFLFVPWCEACQQHGYVWRSQQVELTRLNVDVNFFNCYADPEALEVFTVDEYPAVWVRDSHTRWRRVTKEHMDAAANGKMGIGDVVRKYL